MANILDQIIATKKREVADAKARVSVSQLHAEIAARSPTRDFVGAMRAKHAAGKAAVIAEIKRKSPSAGEFRANGDFDPARFAASYEKNGAACLSVLTDRDYFGGSADDLRAARTACALPIIRKDFIIDEYQIVEARAMGADAVLFIMGVLPIAEFQRLEAVAESLGLAVLAESHNAAELAEAQMLATPLIGINNRDLTQFVTKIDTTLALKPQIQPHRMLVTESGIENPQTIDLMRKNDVSSFLVGGALMKADDPGVALKALFRDWV
jgi:indole-3-glycerol phosphate synthase